MNKKILGGIIGVALVVGIAASLIVPSKLSEHYYAQAVEQDSLHNYVDALELYKKASDRNPEASYRISTLYGRLLPDSLQDPKAAFEYLVKSYEDGRLESAYLIAYCYKEGFGVEKDSLKVLEYLEKPSGTEAGKCKFYHAYTIYSKDSVKAVSLLKEASDLQYPDAMYSYGMLHFSGTTVPMDIEKGEKLLVAAADSGNVNAQSILADMYVRGEPLKKDSEKGFKYATMAAKQGDARNMVMLGYCYVTGQGVAKDDNQAYYWFNKGAEKNEPMGIYYKAQCLIFGLGTVKNVEEGNALMRKAAEMGEENAIMYLKSINRPVKRSTNQTASSSYTPVQQYRCYVCNDTGFVHSYDSNGIRRSSFCPVCSR